ncbi:MAG TPA: hypothetical protein PK198_14595, partial [Saprospiraceae bacterium]|nr:hypothetical protein [Saprospiraceae bacterium]
MKLLLAFIATISIACGTKNVPTSIAPAPVPAVEAPSATPLLCGGGGLPERWCLVASGQLVRNSSSPARG